MDKQLHETLAQVTMYSKMGRYISNKILKYNKHANSHRNFRSFPPPPENYLPIKKTRYRQTIGSQHISSEANKSQEITEPSVGYYKLNYNQIQKNPRFYDFNRSVPHFKRDKYFCHEVNHVLRDLPDSYICQERVTGFKQLKRMTGRQDIKGSIRKQIEDPHQNRFIKFKNNISDTNKSGVNMQKQLPRDNKVFLNHYNNADHDYDIKMPMKRLDTHIIPFEKIIERNGKALECQTGISNNFDQHRHKSESKLLNWKKMLAREKAGILPSYMDKNINTRSSIMLLTLKTLQMNCSKIQDVQSKKKKKKDKPVVFIEQKRRLEKQNSDFLQV